MLYKNRVIQVLQLNKISFGKLSGEGLSLKQAKYILLDLPPDTLDDRDNFAYIPIREPINRILGPGGQSRNYSSTGMARQRFD